jgi:integrase
MSTGFVPSSVSGVRHPATLGSSEVEAFPVWLANRRKVSVSTHRQALAALLFFYGKVLCTDRWLQEIGRPRPSRRLPVVLTPDEVVRISVFWKASIVCSPSFCMGGHADQ